MQRPCSGTELTMDRARSDDDIPDLAHQVRTLIGEARRSERRFASQIADVHPEYRGGAINLSHYLALRRFDLRNLQESLARWGMSSLGRTEAHVMPSLTAVSEVLDRLGGRTDALISPIDFLESRSRLADHADRLFGAPRNGRGVRIMVTMPHEAANDYGLVRDLVAAGMDCARINCAHDDTEVWARLVELVRRAEADAGRSCRILMDLAGRKPRTGPLEPGPEVVRWKPRKDSRGMVTSPSRVWLAPSDSPAPRDADCVLPVDAAWVRRVQVGDTIRLRDIRSKERTLGVVERCQNDDTGDVGVVALADKSGYVATGTRLELIPREGTKKATMEIGKLPPVEEPIILKKGEILVLDRLPAPGRGAVRDQEGVVTHSARVPCTLPDVFADLRAGEPVKLDDGKIEGVIRSVSEDEVRIEITLARENGSKLRADKSINFPESDLRPGGLTDKDLHDLDFVARFADLVGLSFAESADTVLMLQEELIRRDAGDIGIVLKIETQRGFRQLPWLLFTAMRSSSTGIMIARGDLAVECGWERMAEVQEEILWLCEAAQVPVIWATQVLEGLAKNGIPSRPEITDAAMAERAECVMLNKGPYILRAIRTLDDVLKRMGLHQAKKTALLRSLKVTDAMGNAPG